MKSINVQPRYAFLVAFFIILIAYSIFEARAYILGPEIWIDNPQNGEVIDNPLIVMEGHSKNISWISLNDRQIFTDEKGKWSEKLIVSPGLSIMTVSARDRFGRTTEKSVQIVLK